MKKRIDESEQRSLLELRGDCYGGEFGSYIPGLLNWVLEMDEEYARYLIKNAASCCQSIAQMKVQTLVESNPIADWVDNKIVVAEGASSNVGIAKKDRDPSSDNTYMNIHRWLYPNYAEYCLDTGCRPIALRRCA